jgi:hypothetical protein
MSDVAVRLSKDLAPVPPGFVARRIALGSLGGFAISIALVIALLGPRPDLPFALQTAMFWVKLVYPISLAVIAGLASERLARPAGSAHARAIWLAVPVGLVVALAVLQLVFAPPPARMELLMGGSARLCPFLVLAAAVPPLLGFVWAMRGLAPTRLRETGAVIGLAAGGAGAFAYAWHCTETGAPFLAVWYTVGIALAALLGWLAGPRVLRWR